MLRAELMNSFENKNETVNKCSAAVPGAFPGELFLQRFPPVTQVQLFFLNGTAVFFRQVGVLE